MPTLLSRSQDDDAGRDIIRSLLRASYGVQALIEQGAAGRLATRAARPAFDDPDRGRCVDLLFASSGIEREIVSPKRSYGVFARLPCTSKSYRPLACLKVLSRDDVRRPQRHVDLRALLQWLRVDEQSTVLTGSLPLIAARGYRRGKDLMAEWRALRGE